MVQKPIVVVPSKRKETIQVCFACLTEVLYRSAAAAAADTQPQAPLLSRRFPLAAAVTPPADTVGRERRRR